MNRRTLILRSLAFHFRGRHLGVLLGVMVAAGVLIGALMVGDCVRASLAALARARLGRTTWALLGADRLFQADLARRMAEATGARAAPLLLLRGVATNPESGTRANAVQVVGVDERFWAMGAGSAGAPPAGPPAAGEARALVNAALAAQLGVRPGGRVVLRVQKPAALPRDAPLGDVEDLTSALNLEVAGIADDDRFGSFALNADQTAALTAFVPLDWLARAQGVPGRANVLLTDAADDPGAALGRVWSIADAQLEVRAIPERGVYELRSPRVFLEPAVVEAALAAGNRPQPVLAYFVNELRAGERATPYSMVAAGVELPGVALDDEGIAINDWLAEDLGAKAGEALTLRYYVLAAEGGLEERTRRLVVRAVVPLAAAADPTLMPDFPGLSDAENCRDWDPGFVIDLDRIRPRDEQYWDDHRGTPKAFVSLATARQMWGSRFGDLTAVRYPAAGNDAGAIAAGLRARLDPAQVGLRFDPLAQRAAAARSQGLDFGQLFLGLSCFLILAALLLTGLLFVFGVEERRRETGTLLALGFSPGSVRRLILAEGLVLAVAGSLLGAVLGAGYTQAVLWGLSTLWSGAVAATPLRAGALAPGSIVPRTLAVGVAASVVAALAAMALALGGQSRLGARALLSGTAEPGGPGLGRVNWGVVAAALAGLGLGLTLVLAPRGDSAQAAGAFFAAGGLALASLLGVLAAVFRALAQARGTRRLTLPALGLRSTARRRGRSLLAAALLACGCFLVVAVGANRHDPLHGLESRGSAAGGFALYAEAALLVPHDLNTRDGRDRLGLSGAWTEALSVVAFRLREGDDASCLNLGRAQSPRLLGVDPRRLAQRGAFTFLQTRPGRGAGWDVLTPPAETDDAGDGPELPGVADQATVVWGLGLKLGDTLTYTDERGRPFRVRIAGILAGSVLQGAVIIDQEAFARRYPGTAGRRVFLIDVPGDAARRETVRQELSRQMEDYGLEVATTAQRLARFAEVERTYLAIFQVLGALGLMLGGAGLGVVVLRNVLERRGELGLMRAVGFTPGRLTRLLVTEHSLLAAAGLAVGVLAALLAIFPVLRGSGTALPLGELALTVLAIAASAVLGTLLAAVAALRGRLLAALRNE